MRTVHECTVQVLPPETVVQVLRVGYSARLIVTGRSMHPTIRDGEAVLVVPVDAHALRSGDIVLYVRDHRLWAHRVIRRRGFAEAMILITQGDSACRPDPPIAASQVIGRVIAVERFGRWYRLDARWHRYGRLIRQWVRRWRCRLGFCRLCLNLA